MYSFSEKTNLQVLLKANKMNAYIPSSIDLEMYSNSPEKAAPNWQSAKGYEKYTNGQFGIFFNAITANKEKILQFFYFDVFKMNLISMILKEDIT